MTSGVSPDDADFRAAVATLADALRGALEAHAAAGEVFLARSRSSAARDGSAAPVAPKPSAPEAVLREPPAPEPVAAAAVSAAASEEARPAGRGPQSVFRETDEALRAEVSSGASPAERLACIARDVIGDCHRCKLHRSRNRLVFGQGNPEASVVFVGEGPGAEEDRQGIPFVGESGQLLNRMIIAMGLQRGEVYIANVVKCRPPNNRTPEPDEVEACARFLRAQLAVIQPRVIVTLGKPAAHALLRSDRPISALRGQWHDYEGIPLMPTYHPAYLLRAPEKKRETWQDLQLVMTRLGLPPRAAG